MIVTVTPNPAVDRTFEVDALLRGRLLRARRHWVDPSGKGVNVSRALAVNGHPTLAVLPVGGDEGRQLGRLLREEGIGFVGVPIGGSVRVNVSIVEPDGVVTKLNEPGPALDDDEVGSLLRAAVRAAAGARWAVCSGSLPAGVGSGFYDGLGARLSARGVPLAIDAGGSELAAAVRAGPAVVKPNVEELAGATGVAVRTLGEAVDAACLLRAAGAGAALVSLGPDGALLVDAAGAVHGEAPTADLRSAVGAGDALLAGFLAAGGHGPAALAEGLAWASAACGIAGSRMPVVDEPDRSAVRIHAAVDSGRPLAEGVG